MTSTATAVCRDNARATVQQDEQRIELLPCSTIISLRLNRRLITASATALACDSVSIEKSRYSANQIQA